VRTPGAKSLLAVVIEYWPSCDFFSASMPALRSTATISLADRSTVRIQVLLRAGSKQQRQHAACGQTNATQECITFMGVLVL